MDTQEKLEQARALAYEGSPCEMAEMAAREGGEVCAYLSHHARAKFGGGWARVLDVESLVPWKELEAWALGLNRPPNNTPEAGKRDEVRAWMDALMAVPSDCNEERWRLLLCGLMQRDKKILRHIMENIVGYCGTVPSGAFCVSNPKIDNGYTRCLFRLTNRIWECCSCYSHIWPGLECGPMGLENDGPVTPRTIPAIARQLGIEPPARILPLPQIITTERTAGPLAIPPRGFGLNP